ncbi:MAG: hypothetical protein BGP25_05225 [Lysobacterales bacterium 63-13]|nr:MAG: hypothetical protein BGP25_05225 [Xanthomonadales bacterium 63-13]
MIRVGRIGEPGAVNIARPSYLGNPFIIGVHGGRDSVCDQYEQWFEDQLRAGDVLLLGTLKRLLLLSQKQDLVLGCYCAPRRCHGETIKRFLEDPRRHACCVTAW